MNKPLSETDLATPKVTTGPISGSRKIYATPDAAPELKVPLREIALDASSGEPPVAVYDPSGPYTDPDAAIDVERGLPRARLAMGEGTRRRRGIRRPRDQAGRQRQRLRQAPRAQFPQHAAPASRRRLPPTSPCRGEVGRRSRPGGGLRRLSSTPPRRFAPTLPLQGRVTEDSIPSRNWNGRAPA